jgi:hypothetical protein
LGAVSADLNGETHAQRLAGQSVGAGGRIRNQQFTGHGNHLLFQNSTLKYHTGAGFATPNPSTIIDPFEGEFAVDATIA